MRRVLGVLLAAGIAAALFALPVWATSDPSRLIDTVAARVAEIVKTKSGGDREAAIRQVLRDNFDLPYMGRMALGAHWNQATVEQRARFLAAVETSEARAYSERLGRYAEYTLIIDKVTARTNGEWTVDSRLNLVNREPIKLRWEVRDNGQGMRIADVKVSGVSMFQTRRADFDSYIERNGGAVEPLVEELEARASRR
jgi:phospholipid transport system substrate-binding protein